MKKALSLLLVSLCVLRCGAQNLTDIYVKFNGLPGTANSTMFSAFSDVDATGSSTLTCSTTTPSSPCRVATKEFTFNMRVNNITPTLHLRQGQAVGFSTVDFVYVSNSGGTTRILYQVHLDNVLIKSIVETSSAGGDLGTQYSLVFDRMAWKYTPYNNSGTAGTPIVTCFDYTSSSPSGNCSPGPNFPF